MPLGYYIKPYEFTDSKGRKIRVKGHYKSRPAGTILVGGHYITRNGKRTYIHPSFRPIKRRKR